VIVSRPHHTVVAPALPYGGGVGWVGVGGHVVIRAWTRAVTDEAAGSADTAAVEGGNRAWVREESMGVRYRRY